ncbi:synaptogyrin-like [Tachypleus tridentatus]|uniref:synaptogyrin-like n=1 Tax=Tachypleus tridentatus TaxID=6853 RepID=UPI003FD67FCB
MNALAYGAGLAGSQFNPINFVQRPQVILRVLCWLFAVIVFGCISAEGWIEDKCSYNSNSNACNFGVGIGVIAFLLSIGFIVLEGMFENISSVKIRRRAVLLDLAISAIWGFMFFVGFCYLSDAWRKSNYPKGGYGVNNLRAAIAFSFFSIFVWAGCAFLAFQRYRQGVDSTFAPSYEADPNAVPGDIQFGGYPDGPDINEAYQEPPFSTGSQSEKFPPGTSNAFQQPTY